MGYLLNYLVGICNAFGVGELRNAPHTLDGRVGAGDVVNLVHVGTVVVHLHRNHFNAHLAADREVSVISWGGTDKFDSSLTAPRLMTAGDTEEHCADYRVVHYVERGVAEYENVLCRDVEEVAEQLFRFRKSVEDTVVTAVKPAGAEAVSAIAYDAQHT